MDAVAGAKGRWKLKPPALVGCERYGHEILVAERIEHHGIEDRPLGRGGFASIARRAFYVDAEVSRQTGPCDLLCRDGRHSRRHFGTGLEFTSRCCRLFGCIRGGRLVGQCRRSRVWESVLVERSLGVVRCGVDFYEAACRVGSIGMAHWFCLGVPSADLWTTGCHAVADNTRRCRCKAQRGNYRKCEDLCSHRYSPFFAGHIV